MSAAIQIYFTERTSQLVPLEINPYPIRSYELLQVTVV